MIKEKYMLEKLSAGRVLAQNIKALLRILVCYISKVQKETIMVAEGQLFRNNVFLFYI